MWFYLDWLAILVLAYILLRPLFKKGTAEQKILVVGAIVCLSFLSSDTWMSYYQKGLMSLLEFTIYIAAISLLVVICVVFIIKKQNV